MNCESAKERLTDWLNGEMPQGEREQLEQHLTGCSECQEEMQQLQRVWQVFGAMPRPEPSEQMPIRFYSMLEEYKQAEMSAGRASKGWRNLIEQWWSAQWALRLAYSLCLLALGVGIGFWLNARPAPEVAYKQQIDTLASQVQEMRRMMMLTLIENPSATERLKAVNMSRDISQSDERVIEALISTLNNDPNVNVRLVSLEALYQLADNPKVREKLVQSITLQDSPLVQAAMVDMMVTLQEKRSVKPLRELLKSQKLDGYVKGKIENGIKVLI